MFENKSGWDFDELSRRRLPAPASTVAQPQGFPGMRLTFEQADRLTLPRGRGSEDGALVGQMLAWLGLELDQVANRKGCVSGPNNRMRAWVVPTDEETMIARHAAKTILGA